MCNALMRMSYNLILASDSWPVKTGRDRKERGGQGMGSASVAAQKLDLPAAVVMRLALKPGEEVALPRPS